MVVRLFLLFIRNRWIRTGSHQYEKIIRLKPDFLARAFGIWGLKKLVLILLLYILFSRKAVYKTMREITIIYSLATILKVSKVIQKLGLKKIIILLKRSNFMKRTCSFLN